MFEPTAGANSSRHLLFLGGGFAASIVFWFCRRSTDGSGSLAFCTELARISEQCGNTHLSCQQWSTAVPGYLSIVSNHADSNSNEPLEPMLCTVSPSCRFLTPNFFFIALWLVPLQFLFQAWHLTGPTCAAVEATPFGAQATRKLSHILDSFAGTAFESCPTHSCFHLQYMLQFITGATLLYAQYRMERANRLAYLQARGLKGLQYWPFVPAMIGVVLHAAVYVQLLAAVWVALQCSIVSS